MIWVYEYINNEYFNSIYSWKFKDLQFFDCKLNWKIIEDGKLFFLHFQLQYTKLHHYYTINIKSVERAVKIGSRVSLSNDKISNFHMEY